MGSKLVYIIVFVLAFVATTGAVYFLNTRYENIFAFDFSAPKVRVLNTKPPQNNKQSAPADTAEINSSEVPGKENEGQSGKENEGQSGKPSAGEHDTHGAAVNGEEEKYKKLTNELSRLKEENAQLKQVRNEIAKKDQQISRLQSTVQVKQDSAYTKWKKEMVKIYESMDSRAVAKIIQKLPDNVARDMIFQMKKKKAAQIISLLSPEQANRLTRIR
ncbi:MAG: MotE family protein [Bacteroidota bacterium]